MSASVTKRSCPEIATSLGRVSHSSTAEGAGELTTGDKLTAGLAVGNSVASPGAVLVLGATETPKAVGTSEGAIDGSIEVVDKPAEGGKDGNAVEVGGNVGAFVDGARVGILEGTIDPSVGIELSTKEGLSVSLPTTIVGTELVVGFDDTVGIEVA